MILSPGAKHYLVTALWSTCSFDEEFESLAAEFEVEHVSEEFQNQAQQDWDKFYGLAQNLFTEEELDFETIGHDFWLTRNCHGVGFWDGDYKNGKTLTKIVNDNFPKNDNELRESVEK